MPPSWYATSGISSLRVTDDRRVARPKPQAIEQAPEGGPAVDLNDLSQPTALEARLKPALTPKSGPIRLTIPGGTARLGDYSVGSTESVTGPLLVVQGDADIYGRLLGNLVTVDGDVIVHPGGLVSGDILALGGEVRDLGGEIGGEIRTFRSTTIFAQPVRGRPSRRRAPWRRCSGGWPAWSACSSRSAALGFGLVMFGRPNLEVVSDTVTRTRSAAPSRPGCWDRSSSCRPSACWSWA